MNNIINYIKNNYNFYILIGITFSFHFVSSEAFVLGIILLSFFYFSLDILYYRNNPLNKKYLIITPLILYLMLGTIIGFSNNKYILHNIVRDIFYHTNTLIVVILCLTMFTNKIKKEQVFCAFLIVGTLMGFYALIRLVKLLLSGQSVNWFDIRYSIFKHGFLVNNIASCSFLFIKKNKIFVFLFSMFNVVMSLISFSRIGLMMIVIIYSFLLLYYLLFGEKKIIPAIIIIFVFFMCLVIINTSFFSSFYEKLLESVNEISFDFTGKDIDDLSWRSYEIVIIIEKYNTSNLFEKIFGNGFGSFINSKRSIVDDAYLSGSGSNEFINEIPIFHNGYFGALFKCGIVGVILYISFLVMLYIYSFIYIKNKKDLFLNLALITYIVLASYVVMGLFHKEVWFTLIFLVIYLIKYHMDDRDNLLNKREYEPLLIE